MLTAQAQRERHILLNTFLVALSFGLAAGVGLVRNMIIARRFGLGVELDTFYAAFKLPDLLFTVVAGGALATAFIPVFSRTLTQQGRSETWQLASAITNLVCLAISGLALLAGFGAPWLVRVIIAPGFTPAQQVETVDLMRLVLVATFFFGISAVQSSVLHSFQRFLLPALAPVVYPLGVIIGALWLAPTWGGRGLAVGAVVGALFHLLVKVPGLMAVGWRWLPVLDLHSPAVRQVLVLMGPRVLDLGVFHLTLLATTNLASRLTPGSVSALEWGWEVMQFPETIIGTAFGLVAFPTFAALAAQGDRAGLRATLGDALRMVITLTVPATLGLLLLGHPLIEVLYQRGAFDPVATNAVYVALAGYALGLVGHSALELVARAFFALEDTITPLIVAVCFGVIQLLLGLALVRGLGHGGLALANSLAISAEVGTLLWLLRRRLGGIEGRQTVQLAGQVLAATALMTALVWLTLRLMPQFDLPIAPALSQLLIGGTVGALAYGGAGIFFKLSTLQRLPVYFNRGKFIV